MMPMEVELLSVGKYSTDISPKVTNKNMMLTVVRQMITVYQVSLSLIKGRK